MSYYSGIFARSIKKEDMFETIKSFFTQTKNDLVGTTVENFSAKDMYKYSTIGSCPSDTFRYDVWMREQVEFIRRKSEVYHMQSATIQVPCDLWSRLNDIINYFKNTGCIVIHQGDVDKRAMGHVFLLWNQYIFTEVSDGVGECNKDK